MKRANVAAKRAALLCRWLLTVLCFCLGAPDSSQGQSNTTTAFHPNSSFAAENLLRNAARHVAEKQWPEAVDLYLRIVEQHGDAVARVPANDPAADPTGTSQLYVNARRYCQGVLAALPADGLAEYRRRVDARAEQLYRAAEENSDRQALARIADEFFASRWGDQAVDLLGDLEFRAGRFREALLAYHRLVPDPAAPPQAVYPDPDVDRARVSAKILLCRAAMGSMPTEAEVEGYRAAYPDLQGTFAGRNGRLGDSLQAAMNSDRWRALVADGRDWPTLGGADNRNGLRADKIDVGSFQWKIDLPPPEPPRAVEPDEIRFGGGFRTPPVRDAEPPTFPIIVDDRVMITDENRVQAFKLDMRPKATGDEDVRKEVLFWDSPYTPPYSAAGRVSGQAVPRYSLTASGDMVFARLGATGRGTSGGILYAIRSNEEIEGKLIWRKPAAEVVLPVQNAGEHHVASYEGAPVAEGNRVYIALTESATEPWVYVACLDSETGQTLWVRHLGSGAPTFDPMRPMPTGPTIGNRMLSLDGGSLYYQTNLGAVACLDAETGDMRWVATYPVVDRNAPSNSKRAPNPALVSEGLVVVAPEDAPAIYAFDAATGRLAWKTDSASVAEIQHLLGISQGKLFATGNHLFTFDAHSGKTIRVWPEAGARFDGYGRGVLAGGMVYWPTRTEILVVDQATGGDVHATIPLFQTYGFGGGNLAVGNGYLAVAQRERLVIFSQTRRLLQQYRQQLAQSKHPASDHLELAKVAEAAGETDLALESLDQALRLARADDLVAGQPITEVASERRRRLLIRLGDQSADKRQWDKATDYYQKARDTAPTARERLAPQLKLVRALESHNKTAAAIAVLQELLEDPSINTLSYGPDLQRRVRADLYAAEELSRLLKPGDAELYAPWEQKASALVSQARRQAETAALRQLYRTYPTGGSASDSLLALAQVLEGRGERAQALDAYQELFAIASSDERRAMALISMAELQASTGHLVAARALFDHAARRFGEVSLRSVGRDEIVGDLAARRLSALTPHADPGGPVTGPLPVALAGECTWPVEARPFILNSGSGAHARVITADGTKLSLFDPAQPQPIWSIGSATIPAWVAAHDDLIVVASSDRVFALRDRDGSLAWQFDRSAGDDETRPTPFTRAEIEAVPFNADAARGAGTLEDLRLDAGRLSFVRDHRELIVVDVRDGRLLWSYLPTSAALGDVAPAQLGAYRWADASHHVLEVLPGSRLVVLDARNGATLSTCTREADALPMCGSPARFDEDHILLMLDPRTVGLFDTQKARIVWRYQNQSALPREVAPSIWSNGDTLIGLFGGTELVRLSAARGEKVWSHDLGLAERTPAGSAVLLDDDRFYCVWDDRCEARLVSSGDVIWRRELNATRTPWSTSPFGPWIALYPDPTRLTDGGVAAFELIFCDRRDGMQRRLPIERPIDRLAIDVSDSQLVIATQSHAWLFDTPGPAASR